MQQKPSNSKEIKIIITNYHFHFIITHATQNTIFHHLVKKSSITNRVIAYEAQTPTRTPDTTRTRRHR
jgi:DNA-binding FadR family transcriptional regulator